MKRRYILDDLTGNGTDNNPYRPASVTTNYAVIATRGNRTLVKCLVADSEAATANTLADLEPDKKAVKGETLDASKKNAWKLKLKQIDTDLDKKFDDAGVNNRQQLLEFVAGRVLGNADLLPIIISGYEIHDD